MISQNDEAQVTQDHIDNGKPKSAPSCPFALAIKEKGIEGVWVTPTRVEIDFGEVVLKNSKQVKNWIKAFDLGFKVSPITFNLDYESRLIRLQGEV